MGVWGFDEIADGVTLTGTVQNMQYYDMDHDWCFKVKPDTTPAMQRLLTNPSGFTNTNGWVECEVEPIDPLPGGLSARSGATLATYLGPMEGAHVTVQGTWSRDRSHSYDDQDIGVFDNGDKGKTEIHPVTSILFERRRPDAHTRQFDFLAFSDDSGPSPVFYHSVPHRGQDRVATFSVPVNAGSTLQILETDDASAGHTITLDGATLSGTVHTGAAGSGKGFFRTRMQVVDPGGRNGATLVSQSGLPTQVAPGKTATIHVVMSNTGSRIWQAGRYGMEITSPGANHWAVSGADLTAQVAPGGRATFDITVTAPGAQGNYLLGFMLAEHGVERFGQGTGVAHVAVYSDQAAACAALKAQIQTLQQSLAQAEDELAGLPPGRIGVAERRVVLARIAALKARITSLQAQAAAQGCP